MFLEKIDWSFIGYCFLVLGFFWDCCNRTRRLKHKIKGLECKAKQQDRFLSTLSSKIAAFELQGQLTKITKSQTNNQYCDYCSTTILKRNQKCWSNSLLLSTGSLFCSKECLNKALDYKKGEKDIKDIVDVDHLETLECCARCNLKLPGRIKGSSVWGNKFLFPNKMFCSKVCLDAELKELRDDVTRVSALREEE